MGWSPATWIGNQLGLSDTAMLGAAAGYAVGGPLGGGVGFGLGNSVSSAKDALKAQEEANAANIKMTQDTNATAIELANTAHQREVADLKAAGLNPILSSKYGGSAVPSLTAPSTESTAPTILSSAKNTNEALSSGLTLGLQQKLQTTQIQANSAQAAKTAMEAKTLEAKLPAVAAEAELDAKAAQHRGARPAYQNKAGWDITDALNSINPFKGWFK